MSMRKIKSREYCHNCNCYSEWEFEDREGNQIITCPTCSHLHYRTVEGDYINFEINYKGENIDNMARIREILEAEPEAEKDLKRLFAELEFGDLSEVMRLRVTDRRWGSSNSNGGTWGVSTAMYNNYTTSTAYTTGGYGGYTSTTSTAIF